MLGGVVLPTGEIKFLLYKGRFTVGRESFLGKYLYGFMKN